MSDNRPKRAWRDPDGLHPIAIRICEDSGGVPESYGVPESDARELLADLASVLGCEVRVKHKWAPFDPSEKRPAGAYLIGFEGRPWVTFAVVLEEDSQWWRIGSLGIITDTWDCHQYSGNLSIKPRIPEMGPE